MTSTGPNDPSPAPIAPGAQPSGVSHAHYYYSRELRAGRTSLLVAVSLLIIKSFAYFLTRSDAVFSDALDTIINVFSSGFALYSIHTAHRPADQEHPYGHGKIEFFSAGLEGGMILLAAVIIVAKVIGTYVLFGGSASAGQMQIGLLLMAGALIINGTTGLYLRRSARKANSVTLQASGFHLLTDALETTTVLIALLLIRLTGWRWIDTATALLIAGYITMQGMLMIRRSAGMLMDEQDADDQSLIKGILDSHVGPNGKEPRICSYHKLRHRHSGRFHWVDFHMMLPAWWDIETGHKIASSIEYEIELALGEGNATAHLEPCVNAECRNCAEVRKS
jgi:cation diffusion facilitator family transporter